MHFNMTFCDPEQHLPLDKTKAQDIEDVTPTP
jgi:hypothetical protein